MEQMQHQMMGYDRTSIMFSPDGRLLQVEYAKKTVKQGTTAMGVVCKDGVLLLADKRINEPLIVPHSIEKVSPIDDHIGATASGIVSDGRILIDIGRTIAQKHRVTYDSPVDTLSLVKNICDIKQYYTQVGGARPFGVSLLIAGVNDDNDLFVTDPTGIFFQYKATAIGDRDEEIKDLLNKEYKENLILNDGLKLCLKILRKIQGKNFDINRIDAAVIRSTDKKFEKLTVSDLNKIK
ncbi:archaeal proteasome endopeptidase complex subunit alpha [Candidatus Woesearchaeota archaeon]|nr:archaeal proteasome endopeptidase complex subunit alpha [Candidatus Woesearchaeota archaeon]